MAAGQIDDPVKQCSVCKAEPAKKCSACKVRYCEAHWRKHKCPVVERNENFRHWTGTMFPRKNPFD